jgi:hypothetical protein
MNDRRFAFPGAERANPSGSQSYGAARCPPLGLLPDLRPEPALIRPSRPLLARCLVAPGANRIGSTVFQ